MSQVDNPTVILLGRPGMLRELLARHLRETTPAFDVREVNGWSELSATQVPSDAIIVLFSSAAHAADLLPEMKAARQAYPDNSLAIISEFCDRETVRSAMALGVKGQMVPEMSASTFVHALRMLADGGEFVAPAALASLISGGASEPAEPAGHFVTGGKVLSKREFDVLCLLRQGKPNKVIAAELDIQEGTVKVHVRSLLRKFQVRNRTEIAIASHVPSMTVDDGLDRGGMSRSERPSYLDA